MLGTPLPNDCISLLQPQGMSYTLRTKKEQPANSTADLPTTRLPVTGILNRKEQLSCSTWAKRQALSVPQSRNFILIRISFLVKAVALHYLCSASVNGSVSGIPVFLCEQTSESTPFRDRKIVPRRKEEILNLALSCFSFSTWAWGVDNCG